MTDHPTLRRWARRLRRITIATVVIVLVLVGALVATTARYEQAARRRFARAYPPVGELVDIGGRRIHLDCRGSGSPTVVFESGLDVYGSQSWTKVHDAIASTTRPVPTTAPARCGAIRRPTHLMVLRWPTSSTRP